MISIYLRYATMAALLAFVSVAAAQELAVPTIAISPDIYYPFEEILYLEGNASPAATVEIRLQKAGERPYTYRVKAQPNGEWALAEKIPLPSGTWEARARLVVGDTNSDWSNPRIFKVVISGMTIAGVNFRFATITLLIVLLLLVGGGVIFFFSIRIRKLRRALVVKEVHEAQESVRTGLAALKNEMLDELKLLTSSRGLSADKLSRRDHLLHELERIEREIEREIGDIESKA
jgi:hypothetical protein